MTQRKPTSTDYQLFKRLIALLDRHCKGMKSAEANASLVLIYDKLLSRLKRMTYNEFKNLLGAIDLEKAGKKGEAIISVESVLKMSIEDVKNSLSDSTLKKRDFERIAAIKFKMSPSELSTIRTKQGLIEELRTLINNQETHDSISRMAQSSPNLQGEEKKKGGE